MVNIEAMIAEAVQALDRAAVGLAALKEQRADDILDGHALAVALTELETAQLWFAKARKQL